MEKDAFNEGALKLDALKEFGHHCREKIIKVVTLHLSDLKKQEKKKIFLHSHVCIASLVCCINARTEFCVF